MIDGEELALRSASTTTAPSRRRDSASSHMSIRSDLESWHGEVEESVHVPGDDEKSTQDAIKAAEDAGIPLPKNIPSSALMGGTIKRLSGRKIKKIIHDDWENDLEVPDTMQGLKIVHKTGTEFPETLRQVSNPSVNSSPTAVTSKPKFELSPKQKDSVQKTTSALSAAINLDKFKDSEDDDFFGDGCETIKVSKTRQPPNPVSFITPPTPSKRVEPKGLEDSFEDDLELPSDGRLRLSTKRDIPKTPLTPLDDLDWGEGSLGTRHGGTRRDVRSNRSSSVSALSPSLSSSFTIESEDETFDGLLLPEGPVNFQERLQKRRTSRSPQRDFVDESEPPLKKIASAEAERADFMEGLEIGDGEVFNSRKLTLHRNVKVKETQPPSPVRPKTSVSLTFTNKPHASTRIPRLSHERAHSTALEPVSESGGPIVQHSRRSQSRMGHFSQTSVSSMPSPSTPSSSSSSQPGTPHRREIGSKASLSSLREPTTTSSQLLKQKRSLPGIKSFDSPSRPLSFRGDRPPSRGASNRPPSSLRPKTPVERSRPMIPESPAGQARRPSVPFLPAGASSSQSQHVTTKTVRHFRRHDSDNSIESRPKSRAFSRTGIRSPSPHRYKVAADTWERLSRPKNKKKFGDGHELDGFDDLPTSKETETKYLKQPITSGPKAAARNKLQHVTHVASDRISTPVPATLQSPARTFQTPRFARDTAASRIARETSLAQRPPSSGPLAPVTSQRVAQLSTRNNITPQPQHHLHHHHHSQPATRPRRTLKRQPQLKPHLISNLNSGKESKCLFSRLHCCALCS